MSTGATSTGHAAKVGSMASAGLQVTPMDVGRFKKRFAPFPNIFSDFVMLNFAAIRKGISTTPGAPVLLRAVG